MKRFEARVKRSYYVRVAVVGVLTLGLGAILMLLQQRQWAMIFDDSGVTRRDGEKFRWSDLKDVRLVHVRTALNHVELIFTDGKALVFPLVLENWSEVMSFIGQHRGGQAVTG